MTGPMFQGEPEATISPERLAAANQYLEDKAAVAFFLLEARRQNLMLNGWTGKRVFDAFARLEGWDPDAYLALLDVPR